MLSSSILSDSRYLIIYVSIRTRKFIIYVTTHMLFRHRPMLPVTREFFTYNATTYTMCRLLHNKWNMFSTHISPNATIYTIVLHIWYKKPRDISTWMLAPTRDHRLCYYPHEFRTTLRHMLRVTQQFSTYVSTHTILRHMLVTHMFVIC